MGVYLGLNNLSGGGGGNAIGTTSKTHDGVIYANITSDPKQPAFGGMHYGNSFLIGNTSIGSGGDPREYVSTTFTANTDTALVNITNATNGGFFHWFIGPYIRYTADTYSVIINVDGTDYTWAGTGVQNRLHIGDFSSYSTASNSINSTVPPNIYRAGNSPSFELMPTPNSTMVVFPKASYSWLSLGPKVFFENSFSITTNYSRPWSGGTTQAAAVTLL